MANKIPIVRISLIRARGFGVLSPDAERIVRATGVGLHEFS